jgi:hypothetical protein
VNWLGKLNSIEKYFLVHLPFILCDGAADGCWFALLASYVLLFAASNGPVAVGIN